MVESGFTWVPFFRELFEKVYQYKDDHEELKKIVVEVYSNAKKELNGKDFDFPGEMDPFSPLSLALVYKVPEKSLAILSELKKRLGMNCELPKDLDGVPRMMYNSRFAYTDTPESIPPLWELLDLMHSSGYQPKDPDLIGIFDRLVAYKGIKGPKLSMALFWMNPECYPTLDDAMRQFLIEEKHYTDVKKKFGGAEYFDYREHIRANLRAWGYSSFLDLSLDAWGMRPHPTPPIDTDVYSIQDFLRDVFVSQETYDAMRHALERKKSIIIQGPPGVGKTFMARRLAYSIIGRKDEDKVETIQFHQSYGYEDFMIGLHPKDDGGFELKGGVFLRFCDRARSDPDSKYFLIIDEINRGNISRVFGESMMLIEASHRGEEVGLMYGGRTFSVPGNVYIIGTMNTADRSLAIMDYALRRRFAFVDIAPNLERAKEAAPELSDLIDVVDALNDAIIKDGSLGPGYRIGHSFFLDGSDAEEIVATSILPLLREYWFDNPSLLEEWEGRLKDCVR